MKVRGRFWGLATKVWFAHVSDEILWLVSGVSNVCGQCSGLIVEDIAECHSWSGDSSGVLERKSPISICHCLRGG